MHVPIIHQSCGHRRSLDMLKRYPRMHENTIPSLLAAALLASTDNGRQVYDSEISWSSLEAQKM